MHSQNFSCMTLSEYKVFTCCCCSAIWRLYCSFIMIPETMDVIESLRFLSVGSRRSHVDASIIRKSLWAKGPLGGVWATSSLSGLEVREVGLLTKISRLWLSKSSSTPDVRMSRVEWPSRNPNVTD